MDVQMHWILSGRCASIHRVSNVIPKKVSESDDPSTFSSARGMPSSEQTCLTVDRLSCHVTAEVLSEENHPSNGEGILHPSVP